MRKIRSITFIIITIAAFMLIALASVGDDSPNEPSNENATVDSDSEHVQEEEPEPELESETELDRIEIPPEGIVLFDEDDIVITAMGVDRDSDGYVSDINFTIVNNGTDEINVQTVDWAFVTGAARVNNFSLRATLDSTIAAGREARERLRLDSADVRILGIRDVYELSMILETFDRDGHMRQNVVRHEPSEIIIADRGQSTFTGGNLVFSNDDVSVYSMGFVSRARFIQAIFVVKNNTGNDSWFGIESVSVNGIMNDAFSQDCSGDIYSDTYRIFRVTLEEEYSEDDINEIEFTLRSGEFQTVVPWDKADVAIVVVEY